MFQDRVARLRERVGEDEGVAVTLGSNLGNVAHYLGEAGRPEEALPVLEEAIDILERSSPDDLKTTASARGMYGRMLTQLERFEEAEAILLEVHTTLTDAGLVDRAARARQRIVELYDAWGRPDESARWRE